MFELHVNIPVPAVSQKPRGQTSKYPFAQMEIGDSFFAPLTSFKNPENAVESVRSRASGWARDNKKDIRFTVAATDHPETGEKSVGCWAVAPKQADL